MRIHTYVDDKYIYTQNAIATTVIPEVSLLHVYRLSEL